jgi:hypothetical protein
LPASKRFRHLNYDQSQVEYVSLSKKLNEIPFPNLVPNSPYSVKATIPSTPLSMMMELKGWLRTSISRVTINTTFNISQITYNFINN